MIFLHEIHEVAGGKMAEFEKAFRAGWQPLVEHGGDARLLWFWHHTHGTGPSYQAVSITAVRDWDTWGRIATRMRAPGDLRDWCREIGTARREVISKILLATAWSPLQEVNLTAPPVRTGGAPGLYLHDTGWPFSGKLDSYAAALGEVFLPQVQKSQMISIEACWTVAPGTGRFHEVVLLQKVHDWERFSHLLTDGEQPSRAGEWMREGLKHRDCWESKLLRPAAWSPWA